jgi:hypothetical protein
LVRRFRVIDWFSVYWLGWGYWLSISRFARGRRSRICGLFGRWLGGSRISRLFCGIFGFLFIARSRSVFWLLFGVGRLSFIGRLGSVDRLWLVGRLWLIDRLWLIGRLWLVSRFSFIGRLWPVGRLWFIGRFIGRLRFVSRLSFIGGCRFVGRRRFVR